MHSLCPYYFFLESVPNKHSCLENMIGKPVHLCSKTVLCLQRYDVGGDRFSA